MKMASRLTLALSGVTVAVSEASLRGQGNQQPPQPPPQVQTVTSHYFGLHFADNPFAVNPWVTQKSARVVDDLDPTAPFDRLDRTRLPSWSGAAAVEPGHSKAAVGYTQPDFVPPYLHPKPFPKQGEVKVRDGIADRVVVAHEDRLRKPGLDNDYLDPLGMYPLVAPADKIGANPYPVAHLDKVPARYDKFFSQSVARDAARIAQKKLTAAFDRVDSDNDNAISSTEYDAEVKGHQKKTDPQAAVLWKQYHLTSAPDMDQNEFNKMAKTGFDLGQSFVKRSDMSGVITLPQTPDAGYWGGGAVCPEGGFIKGVQIKVKPNADKGDNTALNCVKFKCEDDTVIQTAEGPDGAWTEWAECLPGQTIVALSARLQAYQMGQDNSGINDLMFKCRSKGLSDSTTLMFGEKKPEQADQKGYIFVNGAYVKKSETDVDDKAVVVGAGKVATDGGWTESLTCGTNGALCGAQGRLNNVKDAKDNMGVTDFRFFCCSKPVDCSGPCKTSDPYAPVSTDCKSCRAKMSVPGAPKK